MELLKRKRAFFYGYRYGCCFCCCAIKCWESVYNLLVDLSYLLKLYLCFSYPGWNVCTISTCAVSELRKKIKESDKRAWKHKQTYTHARTHARAFTLEAATSTWKFELESDVSFSRIHRKSFPLTYLLMLGERNFYLINCLVQESDSVWLCRVTSSALMNVCLIYICVCMLYWQVACLQME